MTRQIYHQSIKLAPLLVVFTLSCNNLIKDEVVNDNMVFIDISTVIKRDEILTLIRRASINKPKCISFLCQFVCKEENISFQDSLIKYGVISSISVNGTISFWTKIDTLICGYPLINNYKYGYIDTPMISDSLIICLNKGERKFFHQAYLQAFMFDSVKAKKFIEENNNHIRLDTHKLYQTRYHYYDVNIFEKEANIGLLNGKIVVFGDFKSSEDYINFWNLVLVYTTNRILE